MRSAKFLPEKPQFITRGKSRGRFAVGLRYEREAQEHLSLFALGRHELVHRDGPWIEFKDNTGKRWCQPDALLVNAAARHCLILEIKYQHTSDAWYQLRQLYLPVLRVLLPEYNFRLLEVVHWFDPAAVWPERVIHVRELTHVLAGNSEAVGTLIFNKRRERRFSQVGHSSGESARQAIGPVWPEKGPE